jgi:hypothetical protein
MVSGFVLLQMTVSGLNFLLTLFNCVGQPHIFLLAVIVANLAVELVVDLLDLCQ